jgi:methyl-accepting chemotaxis protein
MPYITKLTPSAYYNRHTDWYKGWFRDVCHAYGTIGANLFYYDCENKAAFAKSLCNAIPLVGGAIGDFFVAIFRSVYNARYVSVYDDWAVAACKIFEQFQGKVEQTYRDIETAVNNAKTYIQNNLINPIKSTIDNNIKPSLTDAQSKINSMLSQLSGFDTRIQGLTGSLDSLKTNLDSFKSRLDGFNVNINDLISRANAFDTKLQDFNSTLGGLTSKATDLDTLMKDVQSKLASYKSLIDALDTRVAALEGKKPTEDGEKKPWFPFTLPEWLKS